VNSCRLRKDKAYFPTRVLAVRVRGVQRSQPVPHKEFKRAPEGPGGNEKGKRIEEPRVWGAKLRFKARMNRLWRRQIRNESSRRAGGLKFEEKKERNPSEVWFFGFFVFFFYVGCLWFFVICFFVGVKGYFVYGRGELR